MISPSLAFWWRLLTVLALEVGCLAALGFMAQWLARSTFWRRTAWQATVVCLLAAAISEWTGVGRGLAHHFAPHHQAREDRPFPSANLPAPGESTEVPIAALPPPEKQAGAVWWPGLIALAGTVLVLGRMALAHGLLLALRLQRGDISDDSLRERVARLSPRLGLRRKISLRRMPALISPMAVGILRPCIGLPAQFQTRFSAAEQDAVLAHEMAHLAAWDPLWFLVADLTVAALWWHPLAWWVRRRLHMVAEQAADEATALVPDGPGALARCLVALGKEMTDGGAWGWVGINGGVFRSNLGKRVQCLLQLSGGPPPPLYGRGAAAARIAAVLAAVPLTLLAFGSIQDTQAQPAGSWRDQMEASWRHSPAGVLFLAQRDDAPKPDSSNRMETAQLYTRSFRVDPNTFLQRLESVFPFTVTNNTLGTYQLVKAYFRSAGVDLSPPKTIFFNDRLGALFVRATASDLEIIQQVVEMLNQPTPQVMITAKFVELSEEERLGLGFNWYVGNTSTNIGTAPSNYGPGSTVNPSGVFPGLDTLLPGTTTLTPAPGAVASSATNNLVAGGLRNTYGSGLTGIMSDAECRATIKAIEQRTGADILASPKVTTLSGRQAHLGYANGDGGVALDVVATVAPDGFSIQTRAIPTIKTGNQTWQSSASCKLWDGQTLVIGGTTTNQPPEARKLRLVFITPRIIDPAGNPVHTDEELSRRPGIPNQ